MSKFKEFLKDILFISKLTGTKNKKKRIALSIFLLFTAFGADLTIIVVIANMFQPSSSGEIIVIDFLLNNLFLLPLIVIFRQVVSYLEVLNSYTLKHDVEESLRVFLLNEVFDKGNFSIGDAYHFMNSFALSIGTFYFSLTALIASLIQLTLYSSYLIYTDIQTLGVLIIGIGILYLPTKFFTKKGRTYAHLNWEADNKYNAHLQKILENIFLIKLLQKVDEEIKSFREILKKLYGAALNNHKVGTLTTSFPTFATYFLLSVLLAFFNYAKILTLDFIGILVRLFQEFSKVNKNIIVVSNNHVVLQNLYELTKNKSNKYMINYKIDSKIDSAIKFSDVSFEYFNSDLKIFKDINLDIPKNKHTVITGPNGSGKSTLLGLSAGLLYPQSGSVKSHSDKFGYVGVTPLIISGTLRENLLYGNKKVIEDKVLLENLDNFRVFNEDISSSLDKNVSNKTLSSGQLQKISFIRVLLSELDILLLDESTSNLDESSRKLIFTILQDSNLTIINCTHNHQDFSYDEHFKVLVEDEKRLIVRN